MKAVILDSFALKEGDLNWQGVKQLVSELTVYPRTNKEDVIERLQGADIAIVNKVNINEQVLCACPNLKWVGVTATGVDTLDIKACRKHGVSVANVPSYSTHSVAQLTFALLLELCQSPGRYDKSVRSGAWQIDIKPTANILPHMELYGKTLGLLGFGDIAQQVAKIAQAFGMKILCNTRTVKEEYKNTGVKFVSFEDMMKNSDVISLHCPATEQTKGIINEKSLMLCKKGARLINTSRGALVNENAMLNALKSGHIAAFGTDVVSKEPIETDNVLLNAPNCIITPHIAWATPESLNRLCLQVALNLQSFLNGENLNVVN